MSALPSQLLLLFLFPRSVLLIPIDNNVEGEPEIECGSTSVIVNFALRNPFDGAVFIQGQAQNPECRSEDVGRESAGIAIPFGTCNMVRERTLNPRGVFVTTTVVVSFHPRFLTKVDRGYRIQCFYMEAVKTVDTDLGVSSLTTILQDLTGGVQQVQMPVCRYEILNGAPDAPLVEYAEIGQQIYHKWTCDTETVDTFCMTVHSCYVDDTAGEQDPLIDEAGCSRDPYLLQDPEYITDLMVGREAHVFKYADRAALYFQCQIRLEVKEPGEDCPKPICEPQLNFRLRNRRNAREPPLPLDEESLDVRSQIIKPLPLNDKLSQLPTKMDADIDGAFCFSNSIGYLIVFTGLLILALFSGLCAFACFITHRKRCAKMHS